MGSKAKRWTVVVAILIITTLVGSVFYSTQIMNPRVIHELINEPGGERAKKVMLLTFPDKKILPVNYLREDNRVYAGADFGWWKSFRGAGARVTLLVQGETLHGNAKVVLDDPAFKETIFARLRPTVPKWLPEWLNGKLVVIALDAKEGS